MTKYAHIEWDPLLFNSQFTQLKRKKMMLQKMTSAKKHKKKKPKPQNSCQTIGNWTFFLLMILFKFPNVWMYIFLSAAMNKIIFNLFTLCRNNILVTSYEQMWWCIWVVMRNVSSIICHEQPSWMTSRKSEEETAFLWKLVNSSHFLAAEKCRIV